MKVSFQGLMRPHSFVINTSAVALTATFRLLLLTCVTMATDSVNHVGYVHDKTFISLDQVTLCQL